jgi:hypothetical protein
MGFPTVMTAIFYRHVIPMGFPTVMTVIFYRHVIPMGFPTVMTVIFYRHVIPMGFPTVMTVIFYRHDIPGFYYISYGMVLCIARRAFISIEKADKTILLPVGHSFLIYESPDGE